MRFPRVTFLSLMAVVVTAGSVFAQGPDVIVGALTGPTTWGSSGGIHAYSIGTTSCNIGDEELDWISNTNEHPVIGQSIYRYSDGKFEHLGQSWLKHGFFALQGTLCGSCNAWPNGSALGVGCSDPYSSSRNGGQGGLGPKYQVNAATGFFTYPPASPSIPATIGRRVQVHTSDLGVPGAQYFGEAQYVALDDAAAGNGWNSASWRAMSFGSAPDYTASLSGPTNQQEAAIFAWQSVDPAVTLQWQDVDGRIYFAYRVTDNGDGTWHYEYAVHNVNSDRSVGSFQVPVDSTVSLANVGFHDVDYHSGEPYDLTDWPSSNNGSTVTWETTPFATNPNANALRWGTLYNFRFDADTPPEPGNITMGLFKPGTPNSITFTAQVPSSGSGIAGPTGLTCSELNHDVALDWTNGASYDNVQVLRDGVVIATLSGSATSYDDLGVAIGTYSYLVRGVVSGTNSGSAFCSVDVVGLPFPENLTCADAGSGNVQLDWTIPFTYTEVRVRRDGTLIATLAGNATSYTDNGLSNGAYHYEVTGFDGGNESQAAECDVLVLSGPSSGAVLVWDAPDANGATAVNDELFAQGYTVTLVTSISGETLALYDAVFVCLGIFPANHQLSAGEGQQLADYVAGGGRVYCEGGDTWNYDPSTAFSAVDGINSPSDGGADLFNLDGLDSGLGLDLSVVGTVAYSGENNWIDELVPSDADAEVCWGNGDNSDDVGIVYLPATQGPVIGCSFQFVGIGGPSDRATTMALYLDAFGLGGAQVAPVTGLTCTPSGSDVVLAWTNGDSYDAVDVYYGGALLASLPGSATGYTDSGRGGGSHDYEVRGVIGSDSSDATQCNANVNPAAPTGFTCSSGQPPVALSWTNGESYDSIQVWQDGSLVASLGGGATSYTHNNPGGGNHTYGVRGVIDGLESADATCNNATTPLAPTSLTCTASLLDANLGWTNAEAYGVINIFRDGVPIAGLAGTATSYTDVGVGFGSHDYEVSGTVSGLNGTPATCTVDIAPGFVRGEVNDDGSVNLADVIAMGSFLFGGGMTPNCLDAVDANDDGAMGIDDMVYALDYIFSGGSTPPAPFPGCGADPTSDALDCQRLCP